MDDWGFWTYVVPGDYTVSFEPIGGLLTPPPLAVTVTASQTTLVEGNYTTGQTVVIP